MIYWLELSSNEVLDSQMFKHSLSSISSRSCRKDRGRGGFYVHPFCFRISLSLSISKSLHKADWFNSSDMYLAPIKEGLK
jgi:hypothetical protein